MECISCKLWISKSRHFCCCHCSCYRYYCPSLITVLHYLLPWFLSAEPLWNDHSNTRHNCIYAKLWNRGGSEKKKKLFTFSASNDLLKNILKYCTRTLNRSVHDTTSINALYKSMKHIARELPNYERYFYKPFKCGNIIPFMEIYTNVRLRLYSLENTYMCSYILAPNRMKLTHYTL
jgi:hypothetical protein